MFYGRILFVTCIGLLCFVRGIPGAVLQDDGDVDEQGLYSKSDSVTVLTEKNFDRKIYGLKHALIVQFYNSYCGHCRAFAPNFKALANEIKAWKNVVQLAVLDCSVEENNEICRQFEVMVYPTLRYLHENYLKGNANIGERLGTQGNVDSLRAQIINKLQSEQSMGRLAMAPPLSIASYATYSMALSDIPSDVKYTFLVFENENSTIGSELALDINDYQHIRVKRAYEVSELASVIGVTRFPSVVAVRTAESTILPVTNPTRLNFLKAINTFLKSKNYVFPIRDIVHDKPELYEHSDEITSAAQGDVVYYSDLEKTLKTALHTEITRYKVLSGEPLNALLDFLDILLATFPFRGNLREYIQDLYNTLKSRSEWSGSDVYDLVKRLESVHAPVFITNLEFVGCRGSQAKYRGYSCGLWTLFHTMTVSAAQQPGLNGPRVLRAMHGYIKNFFGCTDCSQHFQAMAARNRIFDVKENDKAVLWLWISHNEVNLRLAGDVTEDPEHPKIQFPSVTNCPECRLARGAWNLPAVLGYLQRTYSVQALRGPARSAASSPSPFSNLDIGLLSLLYMQP